MIKEIKNKNEWESFLINCKNKTFLQSWNWGKFNEELGKKIWRLGIYENDELLAICLVVKIKARRGIYLLITGISLLVNGIYWLVTGICLLITGMEMRIFRLYCLIYEVHILF